MLKSSWSPARSSEHPLVSNFCFGGVFAEKNLGKISGHNCLEICRGDNSAPRARIWTEIVEIVPTSLPELFKPFRTQHFQEKTWKHEFVNISKNPKKLNDYLHLSVRDFPWTLGRNRYSWLWRSRFCYQIQWKTLIFKEKLEKLNFKNFEKFPLLIFLFSFFGLIGPKNRK